MWAYKVLIEDKNWLIHLYILHSRHQSAFYVVCTQYIFGSGNYFQVGKVLHTILGVPNGQMPHAVESADMKLNDIPWWNASTYISRYLDQNKRSIVLTSNIRVFSLRGEADIEMSLFLNGQVHSACFPVILDLKEYYSIWQCTHKLQLLWNCKVFWN